jgi:DNA-binding transcriptional ArsR family regulator
MPRWTLLTNYALVLGHLARYPRITARELADAVGITERAVRRIIADLVDAGYILKRREGRRTRYRVNPDLPLRHPAHQDTAVGSLLKLLGLKKKGPSSRTE